MNFDVWHAPVPQTSRAQSEVASEQKEKVEPQVSSWRQSIWAVQKKPKIGLGGECLWRPGWLEQDSDGEILNLRESRKNIVRAES